MAWKLKKETWKKLGKMSVSQLEKKANANMYLAKKAFERGWKNAGAKSAHWSKILWAQAQKKREFGIQTKISNGFKRHF